MIEVHRIPAIYKKNSTRVATTDQFLSRELGTATTQLTRVAAQLGIPNLLKDGPKSVEELAAATGTQASALSRLMRALTGLGIFVETETRQFRCTHRSAVIGS